MSDDAKPGWSFVTVGKELGVTNTTIRFLLKGTRYPSIMIMRRIERVYKWPILEQISCIPDIGYDKRYAEEFRYWLGEQCKMRAGSSRQNCDGCSCPVVGRYQRKR